MLTGRISPRTLHRVMIGAAILTAVLVVFLSAFSIGHWTADEKALKEAGRVERQHDAQLAKERKQSTAQIEKLVAELNAVKAAEAAAQGELGTTRAERDELAARKAELEKQIAALKATQAQQQRASRSSNAPRGTPTSKPTTTPVVAADSGDAKGWIYNKESGNNPAAVNSQGCRGIGQACPGSKLTCSSSDYACQDVWFTGYMKSRYGTWENAKAKWISRAEPCRNGTDWCGGWW